MWTLYLESPAFQVAHHLCAIWFDLWCPGATLFWTSTQRVLRWWWVACIYNDTRTVKQDILWSTRDGRFIGTWGKTA